MPRNNFYFPLIKQNHCDTGVEIFNSTPKLHIFMEIWEEISNKMVLFSGIDSNLKI